MLNRIIKFSLDNRLMVVIGAVAILITGLWTLPSHQIDVFPDLTAPTVVIMTESESMSAEDVERLVTFPIETAVNGASGVRRVRSTSQTGFSVVTVEFDWGEDLYLARQIISEKILGIESELPDGVKKPIMAPPTSLMGEIMVVGLTSDGNTSLRDLRTIADWTFRPRLLSTPGVATVNVTGGEVKQYNILLSPARMKNYGITVSDMLSGCTNLNADGNGGIMDSWGNEYVIRTLNRSTDPSKIAENVLKLTPNGEPVTIADVADVVIGNETPRIGDASVDAKPAVRLSITKQPGISTPQLTEQLDKTIAEISKTLPADVHVRSDIFRQEEFIRSSVDNIFHALTEGGILVIVILFLFLGNPRTSIISVVALPLSLIVTILVMRAIGMSLNTMSIGGMAIAVGSLVDDAIIDVENVYKRLKENTGRPKLDIIYEASSEIRSSIWNATLIIIVTFIPLFVLSGMEGRMLRPLGIAFIISLLASMFVAITLTPVMSSYLLTGEKHHKAESRLASSLKEQYRKILTSCISHPRTVVVVTLILLAGAIGTFPFLGNSFLPPFNEGSMTIEVSAMPGISLDESIKIGTLAENEIMKIPEVRVVSRKTGRSELDEHALGTNTSEMDVPFTLDERSKDELFADTREKLAVIPGVSVEVGQPISHRIDMLLSGSKTSIAIKIFGTSLSKLLSIGEQVKKSIEDIPGIVDLKVEQLTERPQIHIVPIKELTAYYGITESDLSETIHMSLLGTKVGRVLDDGKAFDIVVKLREMNRSDISDIENIPIHTEKGDIILGDIAKVVSSEGFGSISRENVSRRLIVSANSSGKDIVGIMDMIKERLNTEIVLPEGYHIEYAGQGENAKNASNKLILTSILAALVVFLLLYKEFGSLKLSSIVMLNLPLALIGAIFTVALTGAVISIPSIIGFISLFGIATRNGLLLVNRYESLNEMPIVQRVMTGSLDRIIPIVMTALTSALALIPLVVFGDKPGNEIQSPMATVLLGGLITSTLLNLIVVPTIYLMTNREKQ